MGFRGDAIAMTRTFYADGANLFAYAKCFVTVALVSFVAFAEKQGLYICCTVCATAAVWMSSLLGTKCQHFPWNKEEQTDRKRMQRSS